MKNIIFLGIGGNDWIGGLYYVKNMIFSLTCSDEWDKKFNIFIYTTKENKHIFNMFDELKNIRFLISKEGMFNRFIRKAVKLLSNKYFEIELLYLSQKHSIDYIFPLTRIPFLCLKDKFIFWIPDFQHKKLNEFFSAKEIKLRDKTFTYMAKNHRTLILSSNDAHNDYNEFYPKYKENVFVVPFVSKLEENLLPEKSLEFYKKKYNLPSIFFLVSNQFWIHKNHLTVFKALAELLRAGNKHIHVVCTGAINDYRNEKYIDSIKQFIVENNIENNVHIIGFIERKEQIALMLASVAVVQPSLFEGWGTVVEDAKYLGKEIILSDINVHFEQMNDKCILFNRLDYIELSQLLKRKYTEYCSINYEVGLDYKLNTDENNRRAKAYGNLLSDILFR